MFTRWLSLSSLADEAGLSVKGHLLDLFFVVVECFLPSLLLEILAPCFAFCLEDLTVLEEGTGISKPGARSYFVGRLSLK